MPALPLTTTQQPQTGVAEQWVVEKMIANAADKRGYQREHQRGHQREATLAPRSRPSPAYMYKLEAIREPPMITLLVNFIVAFRESRGAPGACKLQL